jgi:two-component system phosphate regulon response regulator OmpR
MMPGEDGIALTRWVRTEGITPVILLTARGEARDRIAGLEAGADDYIPKPFEPRELVLRVNAILRRAPRSEPGAMTPQVLMMGSLRYDVESGELRDGTDPVRLTQTESALMRVLAANAGKVVSREALVDQLGRDRGQAETAQERAIDVQITRLRRKIEADPRRPQYLQTVRGEGYMLTTA